jgi:hypothetical protein
MLIFQQGKLAYSTSVGPGKLSRKRVINVAETTPLGRSHIHIGAQAAQSLLNAERLLTGRVAIAALPCIKLPSKPARFARGFGQILDRIRQAKG